MSRNYFLLQRTVVTRYNNTEHQSFSIFLQLSAPLRFNLHQLIRGLIDSYPKFTKALFAAFAKRLHQRFPQVRHLAEDEKSLGLATGSQVVCLSCLIDEPFYWNGAIFQIRLRIRGIAQ